MDSEDLKDNYVSNPASNCHTWAKFNRNSLLRGPGISMTMYRHQNHGLWTIDTVQDALEKLELSRIMSAV